MGKAGQVTQLLWLSSHVTYMDERMQACNMDERMWVWYQFSDDTERTLGSTPRRILVVKEYMDVC